MASKSPAVEIDVDDRTVRVTNPDREYFAARGETKLDLVHYYLSEGDGSVRALDDLGAVGWPKTSGGNGLHIYVRIAPTTVSRTYDGQRWRSRARSNVGTPMT